MGSSDGPFSLGLTHPRLLVVSYVPQLQHTGQCPGKARRHKLPSAHEDLDKVTMHAFMGPFAPPDPTVLYLTLSSP